MSVRAMTWAFLQMPRPELTASDKLVLIRLADRADPEGECFPAVSTTASDLGLSVTCTRDALRRLEALRLIRRVPRFDARTGRQRSNIHRLALDQGADSAPYPNRTPEGAEFGQGRLHKAHPRETAESTPEPPEETSSLNQQPPSARTRAGTAGDGGDFAKELIELALANGLTSQQAEKFAAAARGASAEQQTALRHELPLRLPRARGSRAGLAIGLANLAALGQLEDSTLDARQEQSRAEARRADEETRADAARRAEDEARAQRLHHGPSAAERAAREYLATIRGGTA